MCEHHYPPCSRPTRAFGTGSWLLIVRDPFIERCTDKECAPQDLQFESNTAASLPRPHKSSQPASESTRSRSSPSRPAFSCWPYQNHLFMQPELPAMRTLAFHAAIHKRECGRQIVGNLVFRQKKSCRGSRVRSWPHLFLDAVRIHP